MEDLTQCVEDMIFFLCRTAGSNNILFWPGDVKFMSLSSYLLIYFMDNK